MNSLTKQILMMLTCSFATAAVIFGASEIQTPAGATHTTMKKPYVMMVTSLDPPLAKLSDEQVEMLNDTPFDGVAISIFQIYDGGPLPDEGVLLARCGTIKQCSAKVIWPRVYLNRMIGYLPKASRRSACKNPQYFDRIKGFDLWDEAGAKSDFLKLWRLSLRVAKALGAPGIVSDFESYNCGGLGNPITLAKATGRSLDDTEDALRDLGAKLADIVAEEYPTANIWSLFTGLGYPGKFKLGDKPLTWLHAYIYEGMLDRAKKCGIPLTLVDGGEMGLGYFSPSPAKLREKIETRAKALQPSLECYGGKLVMGGTITVWNDDAKITGWVREDAGKDPFFKKFMDFKPMLAELFHAYSHVWFYVPSVADYNPFDRKTASQLNPKLRELIESSLKEK